MFAAIIRASGNLIRPSLISRPITGRRNLLSSMAALKRKQSAVNADGATSNAATPPLKRRASSRNASTAAAVNPDTRPDIIDAPSATRASPDCAPNADIIPEPAVLGHQVKSESPLSDAPEVVEPPKPKKARGKKAETEQNVRDAAKVVSAVVDAAETQLPVKKGRGRKKEVKIEEDAATDVSATTPAKPRTKSTEADAGDPEADGEEDASPEELKQALARPPPVNSSYLPLPWKGRLGYACLNTYLRSSNPPIFSSRTCRIQSILEHRHPLADPEQPEHATKNRPDRSKPADMELGKRYVEEICLANVRDIAKMIRWNEKYGIRFLRLSSEMFPFASHPEYGYPLETFAADALAEAGKVIARYGHRVTTHPGQFTQLGSPRKQVIDNAFRDLEYHDSLLSLLKLPDQLNRDAVMILHMGGIFDGKEDTLQRFRENYAKLSDSVKRRLVLENDDVCYNVHELLPICEELNIPFVLDFHHHNIVFDSDKIREGTADIVDLFPRILKTWERKGITPKMHYSEPTPAAITPRQRRKHSPRVASLPPCPPTMDLMIEAKDKEQAVFELMRNFKLPGYDTFNEVIPYERHDDNKFADSAAGQRKIAKGEQMDIVAEEQVGMGGPEGRVYWPPSMEEYLRPKKREVKKKDVEEVDAQAKKLAKENEKKKAAALYAENQAAIKGDTVVKEESESDLEATPATKKAKAAMRKKARSDAEKAIKKAEAAEAKAEAKVAAKPTKKGGRKKVEQVQPTPSPSEDMDEEMEDVYDDEEDEQPVTPAKRSAGAGSRKSNRGGRATVSYNEDEE